MAWSLPVQNPRRLSGNISLIAMASHCTTIDQKDLITHHRTRTIPRPLLHNCR